MHRLAISMQLRPAITGLSLHRKLAHYRALAMTSQVVYIFVCYCVRTKVEVGIAEL